MRHEVGAGGSAKILKEVLCRNRDSDRENLLNHSKLRTRVSSERLGI